MVLTVCFPVLSVRKGSVKRKVDPLPITLSAPTSPAMGADNFFDNGQAQPHTGFLILPRRAIKLLKQVLQFFLRHALPGVFHKERHPILLLFGPDGHRAAGAGESKRV